MLGIMFHFYFLSYFFFFFFSLAHTHKKTPTTLISNFIWCTMNKVEHCKSWSSKFRWRLQNYTDGQWVSTGQKDTYIPCLCLFVAMSQELGPMNKPHQNYEPPVQHDNAGIVSDKLACSLATWIKQDAALGRHSCFVALFKARLCWGKRW